MDDEALEISIVNDLRDLARVAARIDAFCAAKDLGAQVGYAVNLSLEEVLTHTIGSGYEDDEPHRIEIIVCVEADAVVVVIVDDGTVSDLSPGLEVDPGASVEDVDTDGLGLFLVHKVMDGVEHRRLDGCNVVTLTKKRRHETSGARERT